MAMNSEIFALADRYVEQYAAHDPIGATYAGIDGYEDKFPALSPDWYAELDSLNRHTLNELAAIAESDQPEDRVTRLVMQERLSVERDLYATGHWRRDLNNIASPLQGVLEVFSLADTSTDAGQLALLERLRSFPTAVEGIRDCLAEGLQAGDTAAIRQVMACSEQTRQRSNFLIELVAPLADHPLLGAHLRAAAKEAKLAYLKLGEWLDEVYAPAARLTDGVGRDRYRLAQRQFLGADPEPEDSYAWGWSEIHRIRTEMTEVAAQILPGASLTEVLAYVEHESDFAVHGLNAFVDWAQDHVNHMISTFGRDQFDLPPELRRCEVRASPGGGSTAAHYTGPNEDGTRSGIYWQPDLGDIRYPLWDQVTTANHEAVPGHHLQIAQVMLGGAPVSRYQKLLGWISGHGEGWALYAERLCAELGLLDRPEAVLGYLAAAQLRAVRVVIDIGIHCNLRIPADAPLHAGADWTWEIAFDLGRFLTGESETEMASEITRYFGWAGQAPSYKLGERQWLMARDDAKTAAGRDFNLKHFHTSALNLGPIGLDLLRAEVVRATSTVK
jgi:uncharacterized protein (DUF885 family)